MADSVSSVAEEAVVQTVTGGSAETASSTPAIASEAREKIIHALLYTLLSGFEINSAFQSSRSTLCIHILVRGTSMRCGL